MTTTSGSVEPPAAIARAQREWSDAITTNDAGVMADLLHPDWVIVTPVGTVTSDQFLAAIRAGTLRHEKMTPAPGPDGIPRIRVYGTTAVLTQRLLSTEVNGGVTRHNDEWTSTVFVHGDRRWKIALMHLTPAVDPSPS